MSLLISLSRSSFFLPYYLTQSISSGQYSTNQLAYAVKHQNVTALKVAIIKVERYSLLWRKLATTLAKTQGLYAYQLGRFFQQQQPLNEPMSAYQKKRAIFWFQQAVKLNHKLANIVLARGYYVEEQYDLAQQLMLVLPSNDISVLPLKMRIAVATEDTGFIDSHWQALIQHAQYHEESNKLVQEILTFNILNKTSVDADTYNQCEASIQLFATNLIHLNKTKRLVAEFNKKPLSKHLCFAPIRYIPLSKLLCDDKGNQTIQCDESTWVNKAKKIHSRFIGIMVPRGGANVHLGILYFDSNDNVDIFSHEISHLLGFIDEYPLPKNHQKCAQVQTESFSYNVAVLNHTYQGKQKDIRAMILEQVAWRSQIADSTPVLQKVVNKVVNKSSDEWRVGTPRKYHSLVGIFPAKSCEQQSNEFVQAYKALSTRSHLEYFEQVLPSSYLALLAKKDRRFLMPSFHYNIALALREEGYSAQAKSWLLKASEWEQNAIRKQKITLGDF